MKTKLPTTLSRDDAEQLHPGDVLQFTRDVSFVKLNHHDRKPGVHVVVESVHWYQGYVLVRNTLSGRQNCLMNDGTFRDLVKLS